MVKKVMATIKKFEDLEIWRLARTLSNNIFKLTEMESFVKDFKFKAQIKSSSGSVMDNIAEGFGRRGNKEFINFLSIAVGSCCESQSQLYRTLDWKYISQEEININYSLTDEIISKTGKLITYLNKSDFKGEKFNRETIEIENIDTSKSSVTEANNKQQTTNYKH